MAGPDLLVGPHSSLRPLTPLSPLKALGLRASRP